MTEEISLSTLGALIRYEMRLRVHCNARECWNSGDVDLQALAARLGEDHDCLAPALKPYFFCSKCGSRDVGFILSSAKPYAAFGHSPTNSMAERPETSHRRRRRRHRK